MRVISGITAKARMQECERCGTVFTFHDWEARKSYSEYPSALGKGWTDGEECLEINCPSCGYESSIVLRTYHFIEKESEAEELISEVKSKPRIRKWLDRLFAL